jgi:TRAP-type C4-dicarboxylate transport system permease small subunit
MSLRKVNKVLTTIHKVVIIIGCICLATLIVIIITNVFLRIFATHAASLERNHPDILYTQIILAIQEILPTGIAWMEEISKDVLFTAITFIGMAVGVKLNIHINVNIIPRRAPQWLNNTLEKMKHLFLMGISIVFIFYGINLIRLVSGSLAAIPGFSIKFQYSLIPVAGVLIFIDSFMDLLSLEKNDKCIDDSLMSCGLRKRKVKNNL